MRVRPIHLFRRVFGMRLFAEFAPIFFADFHAVMLGGFFDIGESRIAVCVR